jgi:hypothetical protein
LPAALELNHAHAGALSVPLKLTPTDTDDDDDVDDTDMHDPTSLRYKPPSALMFKPDCNDDPHPSEYVVTPPAVDCQAITDGRCTPPTLELDMIVTQYWPLIDDATESEHTRCTRCGPLNEPANHHTSTQLQEPNTVPDVFEEPPVAFATVTRTADTFSALYSAHPVSLDHDKPPVAFDDEAEPYRSNTLNGDGKQPPNPMNAP